MEKLERGDIILVHTRAWWNFPAWAIRSLTGSYWDHAGMIYFIPYEEFPNTFVIESLVGGIDIRNLSHYLNRSYDIKIKRLTAEWYSPWRHDIRGARSIEFSRLVRGYALQEIDTQYGFSMLFFIFKRIILSLFHVVGIPITTRQLKGMICSGFIQWAYVVALRRFKTIHPYVYYSDVIFSPRVKDLTEETLEIERNELLSTTPGEIDQSDKLYEVTSFVAGRANGKPQVS